MLRLLASVCGPRAHPVPYCLSSRRHPSHIYPLANALVRCLQKEHRETDSSNERHCAAANAEGRVGGCGAVACGAVAAHSPGGLSTTSEAGEGTRSTVDGVRSVSCSGTSSSSSGGGGPTDSTVDSRGGGASGAPDSAPCSAPAGSRSVAHGGLLEDGEALGTIGISVDGEYHALLAVACRVGLGAEEPERGGGVVDGETPLGEGGGVVGDELEARVDTLSRCGLDLAGVGEGGLRDRVVLALELERNGVAGVGGDVGRAESQLTTSTNQDEDVRSRGGKDGSKSSNSKRENAF